MRGFPPPSGLNNSILAPIPKGEEASGAVLIDALRTNYVPGN